MEQFRHIGEVLGSLKALMVFQHNIQINQRQCCFLLDILTLAYETIAEEMRSNLRFEEKNKWGVLEHPLKELYKIFQEAEAYIRNCFDNKDWWVQAIIFYKNRDSVEFHLHNLLCCIPIVIGAIETAGELSCWDEDQINKRRFIWSRKYQNEWNDPKLFQWRFGKQYLATTEICNRIDAVQKEDQWIFLDKIRENDNPESTKHGQKCTNIFLKNLDEVGSLNGKLLPCSILLNSKDYQVRKRLGNGGEYKEISWLGETFVLRHIKGDIESLIPELSQLLSLSHPNILQFLCGFTDEEKKECFLISEQMSRNLGTHVRELYSPRKRIPVSLPVAIDMMLQIARGMEYLHSKNIFHGNLKPSNILARTRNDSSECYSYTQVKVTRFGLSSVTSPSHKGPNPSEELSYIWHAPEVLTEYEESKNDAKYTEKSDVYSYGMICFELLTGKVPFEDAHLQGDKMGRNIRAGERPLFPHHCPKYVTNLTKRCWHSDQDQRPSFSSICRILRCIKRFLAMNPDYSHPDSPVPQVEYCDIETAFLKKFPSWISNKPCPVSEIPFQMFAYQVMERERCLSSCLKDTYESGSEATSISGDEPGTTADDPLLLFTEKKSPVPDEVVKRRLSLGSRFQDTKTNRYPGTPKGRSPRPPPLRCSRSVHQSPENRTLFTSPRVRRKSGHASSDSELS